MKVLNQAQIESNKAKYQAMVGKKVTVVVTGATVIGTVVEFKEDQYTFNLVVEHEPVVWGKDTYTKDSFFARKCDDWGSLNNTKLLDEYGEECIMECREMGMDHLTGEQAKTILIPSHGPENYYCDGELTKAEALENWKAKLKRLNLYSHQIDEAVSIMIG